MAWTNSNWRSLSTPSARLARLALFLQEVEDAMEGRSTSVGSDGKSLSREQLTGLYDRLTAQYQQLSAVAGTGGGRSLVRLTRPNSR